MLEDLIEYKEYLPLTYALILEEEKYYCGFSTNLNQRLAQHIQGKGAKWTSLYPVVGLLEVRLGNVEKDMTLEYMNNFGWENCRGYSWCSIDMDKPPVPLRTLRPAKVL